jgi:hypothetical protein
MPPLQIDLCQDKTQTVPIAHKLNATTGVCSYATHPPHRRYIRGVHVRGALGERSQGAPVPEAAVPLRYVENGVFEPLMYNCDHVAKTGSGQT